MSGVCRRRAGLKPAPTSFLIVRSGVEARDITRSYHARRYLTGVPKKVNIRVESFRRCGDPGRQASLRNVGQYMDPCWALSVVRNMTPFSARASRTALALAYAPRAARRRTSAAGSSIARRLSDAAIRSGEDPAGVGSDERNCWTSRCGRVQLWQARSELSQTCRVHGACGGSGIRSVANRADDGDNTS